MKFAKGPKIHVHVTVKEGKIVASTLSSSDRFSSDCVLPEYLEWLYLYAEKKPTPLFLSFGKPFQKQVMKHMSQIPFGKTMSYSELAKKMGKEKAMRAVGNAAARNPFPLFVPCHRLIQKNGKLGGFAFGLDIKRRLLEFEKDSL